MSMFFFSNSFLPLCEYFFGRQKQTIFIGDVHGCLDELLDLLQDPQLDYRQGEDTLVFVGDFVNKGADSIGVLRFIRRHQKAHPGKVKIVLGNHELKLLACDTNRSRSNTDDEAKQQSIQAIERITLKEVSVEGLKEEKRLKKNNLLSYIFFEMTPEEVEWLKSQPLQLRLDGHTMNREADVIVVHAGINTYRSIDKQDPWEVAHMRNIIAPSDGKEAIATEAGDAGTHWADLWKGPELVFYGHDARKGIDIREHSIGLDSGCVYGKCLSAYSLPLKRLFQHNSIRAYQAPKDDNMY